MPTRIYQKKNMTDYPTLAIPLTDVERNTLQSYESYLEQYLPSFFEVGRILVTIRNQKLYRESHRTFEAYCAERWQISRPRAYQLMDAADIKEELSTACRQHDLPEPTTEAQTRALKQAPQELRAQVWTSAVNAANGTQPSAPQVKQAVLDFSPKPEPEPEYEPHTDRQIISCTCGNCGRQFEKPEDNPVTLCGECVTRKLNGEPIPLQPTSQATPVTLLYHVGAFGVYVPDDIEIGEHDELFVHSPYGERFKQNASPDTIQQLIRKSKQNPYLDSRLDWTCGGCGKFFRNGTAYVYDDGRVRCWECAGKTDPCSVCKSAHPYCDGCCKTCVAKCNGEQTCRLKPAQEDVKQEDTFESRLARCHDCLGNYYKTDKGIARIDEVNEHLATVRGVTYPWPPESQTYAAMTANFELEELLEEVTEADWLRAKRRGIDENKQKETQKEEQDELQQDDIDRIASLANHDMRMEFEAHGEPCDLTITPGMVECVMNALKRYGDIGMQNTDRDKLMRAGLTLYRADEHSKRLLVFTRSSGCGSDVDKPWGSWKTAETFKTKKALKDRIKELEQQEDVILDGRI